jgi:FlaA1/EpsC-like NDP-sugar epimerase
VNDRLPLSLLWGASGHALVGAEIIRCSAKFRLVGFLDDIHKDRWGSTLQGLPILGGADRLPELRAQGVQHLILAMEDCRARLRLADLATRHGFILATAIHPW